MARETRIGLALMVLLVGVFGFMVYKKWNSRQPTAMAAAAEASAAAKDDNAPAGETESAPAPSAQKAATDTAVASTAAPADPFAKLPAKTNVPVQQSEPIAAFADEAFVREPRTAPAQHEQPSFTATAAPPRQAEPTSDEPVSVFGELASQPVDDANPFGETTESKSAMPAVETAATDPFSSEGSQNNEPPSRTSAAIAAAPVQTTSSAIDDPFGDASAEAVSVEAAPAATTITEEVAASPGKPSPFTDDAFAEPVPSTAGITAPGIEEDPFSEQATASPATAETAAPERLFADENEMIPVARTDEADDTDIPSFEMTSRTTPVAEDPAPTARNAASARTAYTVVAENDSYWTISKRIYGTPAYFHALAKFNAERIQDPNRLKPGMKVLTPDPQELSARFPNLVSRSASAGSESEEEKFGLSWDAQGQPIYRVDRSDTLSGIAQSHLGRASRWVQIYEMNRKVLPDTKTLKPGTILRLPADASRVRLVPEG